MHIYHEQLKKAFSVMHELKEGDSGPAHSMSSIYENQLSVGSKNIK
jgi:hypothetical protein